MKKVFTIAGLAALALASAALAGVATPESAHTAQTEALHTITVSGTGTVETVPDQASFSFGVESHGRSAKEALAANAIEIGRVIAALRRAGVAEKDIRTEQVSLMPRYSDGGAGIVGYAATNTVAAELRDIDLAGAVVDAAAESGANHVYGPTPTRSDQEALYRTALRAAVADARAKAEVLAAASGSPLGRVLTVAEAGSEPPVPYFERSPAGAAAPSTPIEPGTLETEAMVTVTFAIA